MFRVHDATGEPIAATFAVEAVDGSLSLVLHSAGAGNRNRGELPRNAEYHRGLELLLRRLGQIDAILTDAYVDSAPVQELPIASRQLTVDERPYPIRLSQVDEYEKLRQALTQAQTSIGSTAASGGNPRKRIRLVLKIPTFRVSAGSADRLGLILEHAQSLSTEAADSRSEITSGSSARAGGQGFITDTATKLAIEALAMKAAFDHYSQQGWDAKNVSTKESFDYLCHRGDEERRVEVKGSTQPLARVLLTPNEVSHALANADIVALFVLSDIEITNSDGAPVAGGGKPTVFDPWVLDRTRLSPTGYSYTLE